jgi:hypothetical protein
MFVQWVLLLRRPHNHQLRTAIVAANWRGCEGDSPRAFRRVLLSCGLRVYLKQRISIAPFSSGYLLE